MNKIIKYHEPQDNAFSVIFVCVLVGNFNFFFFATDCHYFIKLLHIHIVTEVQWCN